MTALLTTFGTTVGVAVAAGMLAGAELGVDVEVGRVAEGRAASAPAPARQGAWPLAPRPPVVEAFAPPEVRWGSGHRGVDLAGHVGQVVRSALPGVVAYAGRIAGRGVVVVDHGPVRTTYEPVTASVAAGDEVGRAGALGTLELFGSHCLPTACLHWGARDGEQYVDPLSLVGAAPRPVRLLPDP